jgi:CheY-like chemotaxis protein
MNNKFILIDDEAAHNLICKININRVFKNAEVISFTYPPDGLDYIKKGMATEHEPTILLLDLNMPLMDGFEVLDEVGTFAESANEDLQVFVLSSTIKEDEIQQSIRHELVKGFIEKPLTQEKIEELFAVA